MKKIKIVTLLIFGSVLVFGFIHQQFYCYSGIRYYNECVFDQYFQNIIKPLIIFAFFAFFASLIASFFSDNIFRKWFLYMIFFTFFDVVFVVSSPVYSGGWISASPTKYDVSIYMGFTLVYTTLIWFALSKTQWNILIKWLIAVPTFIIAVVLTVVLR